MKMIVGTIGVSLMGIGIGTMAYDLKTGLCMGIVLLGAGLVIDAIRKNKR